MFNAGAMPYLIQGMKSDIDGMKAACAQTARNIYVLGTTPPPMGHPPAKKPDVFACSVVLPLLIQKPGFLPVFVRPIVADVKYRRAFMKGGGIAQLVRFLDM